MFQCTRFLLLSTLVFGAAEPSMAGICKDVLLATGEPTRTVIIDRQNFLQDAIRSGAATSSAKTDDGEYVIRFHLTRSLTGTPGIAFEFEIPSLERAYYKIPNSGLNFSQIHTTYRSQFLREQKWESTSGKNGKIGNLTVSFVLYEFTFDRTPLRYYKLHFVGLNKDANTPPRRLQITFDQMTEK